MAASGPGVLLGNVRTMRRNSALAYIDPASGDPALLLHLADGRFVSFDTVCTHAGCTVPYDPTKRLLICPCHGATFDPARGARVLRGPARQPLTALPIRLDAHGNAYALDAKPGSGRSTGGLHAAPRPGAGGDDRGGEGDDGNGRSGHGDD
jgi:thiosulfate dehydrogenase [quinone] large subunit